LPSKASVKISIRTVPNQNVKELKNLIIKHLSKEKFEGIKLNIKVCKSGSNAVLINNKSVAHIAAINSFKDV
jgi:acetylornithine deacetylase/succinyl-diaminopimelate desuccinylase-like protein|tara:strand:- start:936 stop:1151 length:216 start_codon:yes stop_codon:yes gene_type:complete